MSHFYSYISLMMEIRTDFVWVVTIVMFHLFLNSKVVPLRSRLKKLLKTRSIRTQTPPNQDRHRNNFQSSTFTKFQGLAYPFQGEIKDKTIVYIQRKQDSTKSETINLPIAAHPVQIMYFSSDLTLTSTICGNLCALKISRQTIVRGYAILIGQSWFRCDLY